MHLRWLASLMVLVAANAAGQKYDLKGDELVRIESKVSYVKLSGRAQVTIVAGGEVSHLTASDSAKVTMEGGKVSHLTASGAVTLALAGSQVSHLKAGDSTKVSVAGSNVSHLTASDSAKVSVKDGHVSHLTASDRTQVLVENVNISHLKLKGMSKGEVRGGSMQLYVFEGATAVVHEAALDTANIAWGEFMGKGAMFGPGARLELRVQAAKFEDGFVEGTWRSGRPFKLGLVYVSGSEERGEAARPKFKPSQLQLVSQP